MNKKAVLGEGVTNTVAIIFLVFILIFFFFLFSSGVSLFDFGDKYYLESEGQVNSDILLLNYLRTPYKDQRVVDLVLDSVEKSDFSELEQFTKTLFEKSDLCFMLIIEKKNIFICPKQTATKFSYSSHILVPAKNKDLIQVTIMGEHV